MKQFKKMMTGMILLLSMLSGGYLTAQPNLGSSGTINSNGNNYQDFIIPTSMDGKILHLTLTGADGGRVDAGVAGIWKAPGQGASVTLEAKIGSGTNEIKPGSTIRFIVGIRGQDRTVVTSTDKKAGGGGGGTGVAFKPPGGKWTLLAVAGGGAGAVSNATGGGENGLEGEGIAYVYVSANTGKGGLANGDFRCLCIASPGGGAFSDGEDASITQLGCTASVEAGEAGWPNGPDSGEPTGGNGRHGGGWGFGGGGGSVDYPGHDMRGGGGGYKGGDVDQGGSSFLNTVYAIGYDETHGANKSSDDGKVTYIFNSTANYNNFSQVKFAYNTSKCIDDYASHTDNGTNIQTYNCHSAPNQWWFFDPTNRSVRSKLTLSKCLDLDHSKQDNGTNIQLWDCNGTNAQKWLFNGIQKTIHSGTNSHKCIDAKNGALYPDANVNVQLWDCEYDNNNMKWEIPGAITVNDPTKVLHIVPVVAEGFAIHSYSGPKSGSNIQLWEKDDVNTATQWYFDGLTIKYRSQQDLCIDLDYSNTTNGHNIQLYTCNGHNAQNWIYDGLTRTIRSVVDPDKCVQVEKNSSGVYGARSNVVIWDCNGSVQQQFLIQEDPCVDDITPPVAKCQDRVVSALTVPTANTIDNGSTDNCGITSKSIESVSGNTWKLTVTDAAGNSSSCTATVSYQ